MIKLHAIFAEEKRASCFSLCLGCICSVSLPQWVGLQSVIVPFHGHTHTYLF